MQEKTLQGFKSTSNRVWNFKLWKFEPIVLINQRNPKNFGKPIPFSLYFSNFVGLKRDPEGRILERYFFSNSRKYLKKFVFIMSQRKMKGVAKKRLETLNFFFFCKEKFLNKIWERLFEFSSPIHNVEILIHDLFMDQTIRQFPKLFLSPEHIQPSILVKV